MELELQLADIIHKHNIKTEASRLKMKIRKYVPKKKICLQYAVGVVVVVTVLCMHVLRA
jgi:hypothetical protein